MTAPAESPSALLRRAADRLDEVAGAATPGPWSAAPNYPRHWGDDDRDAELIGGGKPLAVFNLEYNGPLNAEYAATVDPPVGRAFAGMLRAAAAMADGLPEAAAVHVVAAAMTAARKILGEES